MALNRRAALALGAVAGMTGAATPLLVRAQPTSPIRIGVLTDLSGPYRDITGAGSVACARLAASEFMASNPDIKVEIVAADHQQKPDIGLGIAREWYSRDDVDAITDVSNSSIAIACSALSQQFDKVSLNVTAISSDLTDKYCTPNSLSWIADTHSLVHTICPYVLKAGGRAWFIISPDYAMGKSQTADATRFITDGNARVVGSAFYPFPSTTDFSSYILQSQSASADVIALMCAGNDLINAVKQAREFGIGPGGATIAAFSATVTAYAAAGLEAFQGVYMSENFYWDLNDRTRTFTRRLLPTMPVGLYPASSQAGNYSAVLHYLKAVKSIGVERAKMSGRAAVEAMKRMPIDDDVVGHGTVRADGRAMLPSYLFRGKRPDQSTHKWDALELVDTIPAADAFRPVSESSCLLVHA